MKRSVNIFLAMLVLVLSFQACGSKKEMIKKEVPQKVDKFAFDFVDAATLSPILDLAQEEGKLVFLDIYTSWCLPCKMMDEDVFSNQTTADIINKDFISYKVDAEKRNGPDLAFIFEVKQFPTLLFLDSKGRVLERGVGAHYHTQLIELAESALAKVAAAE